MRKKLSFFASVLVFVFCLTVSGHAALIDRGEGLIYDDDLDITWLAATTTAWYPGGVGMNHGNKWTWYEATSWTDTLVYDGGAYGDLDDWRLPLFDEMSHIFYVDGISSSSSSPFPYINPGYYWTQK